MRLSEVTDANKPYIRVTKNNRRIEIPLKLSSVRVERPTTYYLGFEPIKFIWQGKVVAIDWSFKRTRPALYCTANNKAYKWENVKILTTKENGKKIGLVLSNMDIGIECDRRRYKRTRLREPIELSQHGQKIMGETVDISYCGLGIRVQHSEILTNTSAILIKFTNRNVTFPINLVRTMLLDGDTQLLGCSVSNKYKNEISDILKSLEPKIKSAPTSGSSQDKGWNQKEIKPWH